MLKSWIGVATAALVVGFGTGPLGASRPPVSKQGEQDGDARQAPKWIAAADAALKQGDSGSAITWAEKVVALLPHDAASRLLLGRAYLSAGRFTSAETALGDALALDPSSGRAAVLRAFAQIANGHQMAALASLEAARGRAPESEIGLALAMMGHDAEAQSRLQAAARTSDADARTRQNLAFAHALQGRWADAAAVAAQDVPADQLPSRLQRWSMIAQLRAAPAMQVGALFGVLPAQDAGQPLTLALVMPQLLPVPAPAAAPVLAEASSPVVVSEPISASPKIAAAPALSAPLASTPSMVVTPMPVPAVPLTVMASAPLVFAESTPIIIHPISVTEPVTVAAKVEVAEPLVPAPKPVVLAEQLPSPPILLRQQPVIAPAKPGIASLARPLPTVASVKRVEVIKTAFKPTARLQGQWVVQLGAFSTEARTSVAWTRITGRAAFLDAYQPVKGSFRKAGAVLHRLSVGGFATRDDAVRVCMRIRATGSSCFVRGNIGDRTLRMAQRERPAKNAA